MVDTSVVTTAPAPDAAPDFPGWPPILTALTAGETLPPGVAGSAVREILGGSASAAQIAGFLVAMRARGESAPELREMLEVVRDAAVPVEPDLGDGGSAALLDIVGTGGDHSNSVNLSTMAAIVAAACGVRVCKHGNRAASSVSGAADVLEALGVSIDVDAAVVSRCIAEAGIGFCFAPRFHPGFRHAGPVRRELGVPTVFNLLGPMANPAPVTAMVVGVAQPRAMEPMAEALSSRGVRHAWVVHGHGGLDELVVTGTNDVVEIVDGTTRRFALDPADHGFAAGSAEALRGGSPGHNADVVREVFAGRRGPVRDTVVLNAAAGLLVAGAARTLADGRVMAEEAIDAGGAAATLERLVRASGPSERGGGR